MLKREVDKILEDVQCAKKDREWRRNQEESASTAQ